LCIALLDHLEKYNPAPDRLKIVFDAPCTEINLKTHQVTIAKDGADPLTQPYDLLVGADGSRSIVRDALMDQPGFDFEQSYFDTVWKVIHIPMPKGLEPETTYFFRHQFPPSVSAYQPNQLTGAAIPEVDGSLCILMFWNQPPDRGMGNPPGIETAIDLQNKVKTEWLPGIELTEAQATEFLNQRPSSILQTRCSRYHDLEGQVVLIGDSAHAMSSYLGQGCQAAFGDVVALDRLLQEHANDLTQVLPLYSQEQVKEGQAITDLNTQLAPRASWLSTLLNVDMALRNQLSSLFPQWISPPFFSLISRTTLPYSEIARRFRPWMRLINWSNRRIISTRKSMST
jgi:kynurenine 3-monooxygenase